MNIEIDMRRFTSAAFAFVLIGCFANAANAAVVCDTDLGSSANFQPSWNGSASVVDIRRGSSDGSDCPDSSDNKYTVDTSPGSSATFCETGGDVMVPHNYRISGVQYNDGKYNKQCGSGFNKFTISQYVAETSTSTYLAYNGYQKIPTSHVLSTYVSRSCNPNVSSDCNTLVSVAAKADNVIWCNTNGITESWYVSSDPPTGYLLSPESTNNCKWTATNPSQEYGQAFRLRAYSSASSGYTCAKSYDDIDAAFVATAVNTSVNCGGNGYRYWSVTRPNTGTTACIIGTSYDHPDGFVITNKQGSNTQCPDGRYTLTAVSGSSISGVCPQSRLPAGYYLSSGNWSNTTCNLTFSKISGNGPVSGVCLSPSDQSSMYPGWYPSNAVSSTHCDSGFTFTLSVANSTAHDPLKWFNSNWVPDGYVLVPRSDACTPTQLDCNKIQLPSENLPFCYGNNNYAIPAGWKKGAALSGTPTCPNQLSKFNLLIDRPPPPNEAGNPSTFINVEPAVQQKPASMPDIGINCPGSGC